jgi:aminomethyltransferase
MEQVQDKSKINKRRIGLVAKDGPPPRSHMEIQSIDGETIGEVTSGCPSPSLAPMNIAMGYINGNSFYQVGSKVNIKVRNKLVAAEVVKMPFLKGKYFVPPKK